MLRGHLVFKGRLPSGSMEKSMVSDLFSEENHDRHEIVMMSPKNIKPYPNNPRNNDDVVEKVANSISQFGFRSPIIVDKDMVIIAGHTRLKASKMLGLKEVPVMIADDLTDEQAKAYRLADNKTAELAYWDDDLLADELSGIYDIDMADFGFDLMDDDDLGIGEDGEVEEVEAPEPPEEPVTKPGDVWQMGRHRLMCGDSTDEDTVLKLMSGDVADLVFTDPPYGVKVVGDDGKIGADNLCKNGVYAPVKGDESLDTATNFYELCESLGYKKQIIFGGNYFTGFLPQSDGWIIWDKRGDMGSNNFADGEMAWCSFHTPVRIYKQMWMGMVKEGEHGKRVHPTQKPVRMLAEILRDFSDKDQIIYDGFGCSGSVLLACEQTDRSCRMIEYEPHYCDVIVARWEALTGRKAELINGEDTDAQE